jgi:hypothetical protein
MQISSYRKQWNALKTAKPDAETLGRLARQIAYSFLDYYLKDCSYEREYIELLCEMSTFSEDPALTEPGAQALFGIIIENLCDDFEELQTLTYNEVMTQIVSYCRSIPAGSALNLTLQGFDIFTSEDLLERIDRIRTHSIALPDPKTVKKIFVLSRVTIGADVAVTSVFVQRLMDLFPGAEIVLIGGSSLSELYGGNPRIRICSVSYSKKGSLLDRLSSWHGVLGIIQQEMTACPAEEAILVDSDSRLSQLGVLPLFPLERYFYFDSRSDSAFNKKMSMAELANSWLDEISGKNGFFYPRVWIPPSYSGRATQICGALRETGARRITVANFGVGGNPRKRVGSGLEERLLLALLREPNTVILLDKGAGDAELAAANHLMALVEQQGHAITHMAFDAVDIPSIEWGMVGVQSRIGQLAALISNSDEYVGYDSACQHIAAALGTPCVTVFAGSNNMRFIRRWSAHGEKSTDIVHVDTLRDRSSIDVEDIVTRIMHVRRVQHR